MCVCLRVFAIVCELCLKHVCACKLLDQIGAA